MKDLLSREPVIKEVHQEVRQEVQLQSTGPSGPGLDQDALDKLNDLLRRVQSLETRADKTDREQVIQDERLDDHERRLKGLESLDMTPVAASGEIDTSAILK